MNKLSTERAIEALYTVRAYYASLTAGYPKGKDCRGIDDVTCSEIANSCLMAIKALEQEAVLDEIKDEIKQLTSRYTISRERGGMGQVEWEDRLIKEADILHIIDKYKESEV